MVRTSVKTRKETERKDASTSVFLMYVFISNLITRKLNDRNFSNFI